MTPETIPDPPSSHRLPRTPCVACGSVHPSLGARVLCYEASIRAQREQIAVLVAELDRLTRGL